MELKLKICGMRDPDNIAEIALLQPDYLGLIFYEKSPRFVAGKIQELVPEIKKTGVFVDASAEFVLTKVKTYGLSAVQLHGNESSEYCTTLKEKFSEEDLSVEIIKVFGIKDEFDFSLLEPYEDIVDFHLFDTKGKNKGGNGITFNWKLLENYTSSTPFFLSGGIGEEEVSEIKKLYSQFESAGKENLFYGIDVNSRFEDAPGFKNVKKLRLFRERLIQK